MDQKAESNSVKKIMSPCEVEALKKCLEENKGDNVKCQSQIEAFKSSCSLKKPNPSHESAPPLNNGVFSHLSQSKILIFNYNSHLGICFLCHFCWVFGFVVLGIVFFLVWEIFSSELRVTKICEGLIVGKYKVIIIKNRESRNKEKEISRLGHEDIHPHTQKLLMTTLLLYNIVLTISSLPMYL